VHRYRESWRDHLKSLDRFINPPAFLEKQKKRIQDLNAVELTGTVADKQMAITIFDHDSGSYVVATFIANVKDYPQQRIYYDAVLGTYMSLSSGSNGRDLPSRP
jgi:hypothetical protein